MEKNSFKIALLGMAWVLVGSGLLFFEKEEGTLVVAVGLTLESVAMLVFIWKKIKRTSTQS
ncbi:hypothetical protein N9J39_02705 [Flavicella sp.]|nr:hypothetical protein [Flavicella sp.]MDA9111764.1 hypothetical protein [Flavicella sp.]